MPTVVALRDGAEIDRVVGMKSPAELTAWLEALGGGETSLDRARQDAASRPTDIRARMELAAKLADAGRLDDATAEYVWLWEHMLEHDPALHGVRPPRWKPPSKRPSDPDVTRASKAPRCRAARSCRRRT